MVRKIEIKTVSGELLFSYEKEDNSTKGTIEEAVMCGANLCGADLRGADLCDADLCDANLRGADLRGADLCGADLCGADLRGANLCGANLCGADLRRADLCGANLRGANLCGANLCDADLRRADLCDADLCDANLRVADLRGADLCGADLCGADLRGADLCRADLRRADLRRAYLRCANLCGADLRDAKNVPFLHLACPSDGAFIGWKKVISVEAYLVKLEVPEDARRSSATSNKCRCDKAKVLAITDLEEKETFSEVTNNEYAPCTYKVGEFVYPDSFDDDRWNECSHGIHFFINKQEAINY